MKKLLLATVLLISACGGDPPTKQVLPCLDDVIITSCNGAAAKIQMCCPHSGVPTGEALCRDFDYMPNVYDVLGACLDLEYGTCDHVRSVVSGCQ